MRTLCSGSVPQEEAETDQRRPTGRQTLSLWLHAIKIHDCSKHHLAGSPVRMFSESAPDSAGSGSLHGAPDSSQFTRLGVENPHCPCSRIVPWIMNDRKPEFSVLRGCATGGFPNGARRRASGRVCSGWQLRCALGRPGCRRAYRWSLASPARSAARSATRVPTKAHRRAGRRLQCSAQGARDRNPHWPCGRRIR